MLDGVVTNGKWNEMKSSISLGDITFWNVFIFLKIIKKWWEIEKSKLKNYLTNWAFQNNSHNWFYRVVLFKNHLFFYITSRNFNFAVNHVTSFSRQKPLNLKTYDCLWYNVLPSCKVWPQPDINLKVISRLHFQA